MAIPRSRSYINMRADPPGSALRETRIPQPVKKDTGGSSSPVKKGTTGPSSTVKRAPAGSSSPVKTAIQNPPRSQSSSKKTPGKPPVEQPQARIGGKLAKAKSYANLKTGTVKRKMAQGVDKVNNLMRRAITPKLPGSTTTSRPVSMLPGMFSPRATPTRPPRPEVHLLDKVTPTATPTRPQRPDEDLIDLNTPLRDGEDLIDFGRN